MQHKKVKETEDIQNEIEWMMSDIKKCINNETEGHVTKQSEIGMKYLFRGWVTKN